MSSEPATGPYTPSLDLATSTPDAIDTVWAEAIEPSYEQLAKAQRLIGQAENYQPKLDAAIAKGRNHHGGITQEKITEWLREGSELRTAALAELERIEAPFKAEWDKRGSWTRAYKVMNGNGHIHSSMNCSTCNKMGKPTQFAWITELSGYDEKEIADMAGEAACTVCYPDAPVDKPNRIFTPQEKLDQAAKDAKAAEREAKRTAKEAKKITAPDGSKLRDVLGLTIETERSAQIQLVGYMADVLGMDPATHGNYAEMSKKYGDAIENIVAALAAKSGVDPEVIRAEAGAKAQKKHEKAMRDWAKHPMNPANSA